MSKKISVYTDSVSESLISSYKAAEDYTAQQSVIAEVAQVLSVTVNSVRQHLVRKGVYKNKPQVKKGSIVTDSKKEDVINQIVKLLSDSETLSLSDSEQNSLEKLSKTTLTKILKGMQ